jgi:hypothetical protein
MHEFFKTDNFKLLMLVNEKRICCSRANEHLIFLYSWQIVRTSDFHDPFFLHSSLKQISLDETESAGKNILRMNKVNDCSGLTEP